MEKSKVDINCLVPKKVEPIIKYMPAHEYLIGLQDTNCERMAILHLAHCKGDWAINAIKAYLEEHPGDEFATLALDEANMWNED